MEEGTFTLYEEIIGGRRKLHGKAGHFMVWANGKKKKSSLRNKS